MSGTGGWYPDPEDSSRVRWWDGQWTEHVRDLHPSPVATIAPPTAPAEVPAATPVAPPPPTDPVAAPPPPPPAPVADPPAPNADLATVTSPRPVSAGAALLPPLPATSPPPPPGDLPVPDAGDEKPEKAPKERTPRSPLPIVIAVLAIGLALFGALWLGGIISPKEEAPVASNPDAVVFQGPGYTFEVPQDWAQASTDPSNVDAAFLVPTGGQLSVGSADGDSAVAATDAELQAAFDTLVRVQQAVYPQVQVVSRETTTLGGAPGQRIILEGPNPNGTPVRVTELAAVRDGKIVFLVLEGTPDQVAAATAGFDTAAASFQFTD